MTPDICPNCGLQVPAKARACPECGSCEKTGWSEDAANQLDLPEEKFDYDDFVAREFGEKTPKPRGMKWFWWVIAVILLGLFFGMFFIH